MGFTKEQSDVRDSIKAKKNTSVKSYAGVGKTFTILESVKELPAKEKIAIIYFNSQARKDAQSKLSGHDNIAVWTNHTVPYAAIGKDYENAYRLMGSKSRKPKRFRSEDVASLFGISDITEDGITVSGKTLAQIALATVNKFSSSADANITTWNVPYYPQYDEIMPAVREHAVKYASEIWTDKLDQRRGVLPITHDEYLKMWSIAKTKNGKTAAWYFGKSMLIIDEAQDTNPVLWSIIRRHANAAIILVGDPFQAIYGWRGAQNYLDKMDDIKRSGESVPHDVLYLTKTFRFGGEVVTEANKWLALAGAEKPLIGNDDVHSVIVDEMSDPDAILCRTNSGIIGAALAMAEQGRTFSLHNGADAIRDLANGAAQLISGVPSDHPDLLGFEDWQQVTKLANEDPQFADLKTLVKLVDDHGTDNLLKLADQAKPKGEAQTHVVTAHTQKGAEYGNVFVWHDFAQRVDNNGNVKPPTMEDINLAYVTVTRAIHKLYRGSLEYIDAQDIPEREDALATV